MNKCLYCAKELDNPKARFCNPKEKMRFQREGTAKTITKTLITEHPVKEEVVEKIGGPAELKFTNESPERRIEIYREAYPNSTFVPNWIVKGYNTKEEALKDILRKVQTNRGVLNSALIPRDD